MRHDDIVELLLVAEGFKIVGILRRQLQAGPDYRLARDRVEALGLVNIERGDIVIAPDCDRRDRLHFRNGLVRLGGVTDNVACADDAVAGERVDPPKHGIERGKIGMNIRNNCRFHL